MVLISQEAINDVATFYANTMVAYPNTWTQEMVDNQIEKVILAMENIVITTLKGERTPLLQSLNDGKTAELWIEKKGKRLWYFSVRKTNEDYLIENAWYYSNASNRAYRRGCSNPNADVSLDDRSKQEKVIGDSILKSIKPILEFNTRLMMIK